MITRANAYNTTFYGRSIIHSGKNNIKRRSVKIKLLQKIYLIFAFGIGFSGFQLLLLGFHALGLGYISRFFTVPYHAGFLAFSLIFLFYGVSKQSFTRLGRLWIPLLLFWFLYFFRIAMDGYFYPVPLGQPPIEYVQKAMGITFIPMFIFLIHLGPKKNDLAFKAFWTVQIACLIFALLFYRDFIGQSYRSLRYTGIDTAILMSSINLSYIGAIAAVISFQRLLKDFAYKKIKRSLFLFLTLFGGISIIFFSGTRSSLLACLLSFIIIMFKGGSKRYDIRQILCIFFAVITVGISSYALMEKIGAGMSSRYNMLILQIKANDPQTGGGRLQIYHDAIDQIYKTPLLGSGLEEKNVRFYPHNHIIEAFMAIGIIGGGCFLILCWAALKKCMMIFQKEKDYGWIACIFLVFFIRGLFSASIIDSNLWYSMIAVYAVPIGRSQKNNNAHL